MENLLKLVQDIVYDVTGRTGLVPETDFIRDLNLTSLDIMNIICAFEDHFDVEIPTRDVWDLHRVEDVTEYMRKSGV